VIKIKKVLLALDYEPSAQKLTEISYSMAKAMNDKVILLHVVSGPINYSTTEYFLEIGNSGSAEPEPKQPDADGGEKKASQYYLIFGK